MLKGQGLTFIRAERNKGISQKNGEAFDFASVTLSDGLESFKLDVKPVLTEMQPLNTLRKGEKCTVTVDVGERFGKPTFTVSDVVAVK
ncbi:hypothetical protein [Viridibacillus arvi]|uniref:hypothetical protein n=1 Tax=Viridibacillus arvi TaxID=263475 RepID=UPI003D052AB6